MKRLIEIAVALLLLPMMAVVVPLEECDKWL